MNETTITKSILGWLRAQPECFAWKNHGSEMSRAGIPDIICSWRGMFVGIEVKAGSNKPSKIQAHTLAKIKESGGVSIVAYSLDDVMYVLTRLTPQAITQLMAMRCIVVGDTNFKPMGIEVKRN